MAREVEDSATTFSYDDIGFQIGPIIYEGKSLFTTTLTTNDTICPHETHVLIQKSLVENLTELSNRLVVLALYDNINLREIPSLPIRLKSFVCFNNPQLKQIPNFPASIKKIAVCFNAELESIPKLPEDVTVFLCCNNPKLPAISILPPRLEQFMYAHSNWNIPLPEIPDTVTFLNIRRLPNRLPPRLSILWCKYDKSLEKLPPLPATLRLLTIGHCPNLTILPNFPINLRRLTLVDVGTINIISKIPRSLDEFFTDLPLLGLPPNEIPKFMLLLPESLTMTISQPSIRFCIPTLRDLALGACIRYQKDIHLPELADYVGTVLECYFCPGLLLDLYVMIIEINYSKGYRQCNLYCRNCWQRAAKTTERVQMRSRISRFSIKDSNLALLEYLELLGEEA